MGYFLQMWHMSRSSSRFFRTALAPIGLSPGAVAAVADRRRVVGNRILLGVQQVETAANPNADGWPEPLLRGNRQRVRLGAAGRNLGTRIRLDLAVAQCGEGHTGLTTPRYHGSLRKESQLHSEMQQVTDCLLRRLVAGMDTEVAASQGDRAHVANGVQPGGAIKILGDTYERLHVRVDAGRCCVGSIVQCHQHFVKHCVGRALLHAVHHGQHLADAREASTGHRRTLTRHTAARTEVGVGRECTTTRASLALPCSQIVCSRLAIGRWIIVSAQPSNSNHGHWHHSA
mmetsp:Transcript_5231/g.19644  ORF Transcript_5231/g.19644 Transcript_5231/m.19644 type:complete len:287 (-) Transcript_5231:70-930(-)